MIVILDTNTIIQNPLMDSDMHRVLFEYLSKTASCLLMPEVVRQELPVVYKRNLAEESEKMKKSLDHINKMLIGVKHVMPPFNMDDAANEFMNNINSIYGRYKKDFHIPYSEGMLEEAVKRAILRIRPCSEEREEFRDTLIWLSVIDEAQIQGERGILSLYQIT